MHQGEKPGKEGTQDMQSEDHTKCSVVKNRFCFFQSVVDGLFHKIQLKYHSSNYCYRCFCIEFLKGPGSPQTSSDPGARSWGREARVSALNFILKGLHHHLQKVLMGDTSVPSD